MALTLKLEIEGDYEEDITQQLDEIESKIALGYTSGILPGGTWDLTGAEGDEFEEEEG
jgi:hypothetical protein